MTITDKQIWEQARRRIGFHQNRPDGRFSATVEDVEIMSFARDVLALAPVEAQPAAVAGEALPQGMLKDMLTAADLLSNRWKASNHAVGRRLVAHVEALDAAGEAASTLDAACGVHGPVHCEGAACICRAPAAPAAPAGVPTQVRKALTLGLQHATWSRDRSRDPIEKRLNEQDVRVIEATLALLPPA